MLELHHVSKQCSGSVAVDNVSFTPHRSQLAVEQDTAAISRQMAALVQVEG